ncbi:MAG: hypothetical protein ABIU05_25545, partial [Nitrospirales bacterium]
SLGGRGSGDLCLLSILGGTQLMQIAPTVFQNTVRPDLRHWELLPEAIVVTQESDVASEPCDSHQARLHLLVTPPPDPSFQSLEMGILSEPLHSDEITFFRVNDP